MIEEKPDDWDPEAEGFRELSDEESKRADYIMRYLVASGKYYPTIAEEESIRLSASVSEKVQMGLIEEKVGEDQRYLRILQKGFVNPSGWSLGSPIKWIIWKFLVGSETKEFNPLQKYIVSERIGGKNA